MIPNFISKGRIQVLLNDLRDWVFPPICSACQILCETQIFCPSCWESVAPVNPEERCAHCFTESSSICRECRRKPELPFPRGFVFEKELASLHLVQHFPEIIPFFLMLQWAKLPWLPPDVVISMPGSQELAVAFARLIEKPYVNVLTEGAPWQCDAEAIEEDKVLLFIDIDPSLDKCRKGIQALSNTFPKKGYFLSVYDVM